MVCLMNILLWQSGVVRGHHILTSTNSDLSTDSTASANSIHTINSDAPFRIPYISPRTDIASNLKPAPQPFTPHLVRNLPMAQPTCSFLFLFIYLILIQLPSYQTTLFIYYFH